MSFPGASSPHARASESVEVAGGEMVLNGKDCFKQYCEILDGCASERDVGYGNRQRCGLRKQSELLIARSIAG